MSGNKNVPIMKHKNHSPEKVNNGQNEQDSTFLLNQVNQELQLNGTLSDISNINNNTNNYSCIIMRSNEKSRSLKKKKLDISNQENYLTNSSFMIPPNQFNQKLDEIEADAQALKRSMLESSHMTKDDFRSFIEQQSTQENTKREDSKTIKKQFQKSQQKYQQLLKEHSTLQHDNQMKDLQIQRLVKELTDIKDDTNGKDYKIKQLRYENDRLFNECTNLKNISALTSNPLATNSYLSQNNQIGQETQQLLDLEQENVRKKVKRLTGEIEVMETYFDSLQTLIKQQINNSDNLQAIQKVFRSLQDSIDYSKDLFNQSKFNVTQGKRVQRKIRYEKLKTEFQQLIIQMAQSTQLQEREKALKLNQSTQRDQLQKQQLEQLSNQLEQQKQEHSKRVDQYKEQVQRMRENIDLFKENMKSLKSQNEELQSRLKSNQTQNENQQVMTLFNCLKEDNERLISELKRLQDENSQLQHFLSISKETIQQQNGVITGLQSVIENFQNQQKQQQIPINHLIPMLDVSRNDNNFFTTTKYPSGKISSTINDSARNNSVQSQERSRSCGSGIDKSIYRMQQVAHQTGNIQPALLHQSTVLPPQLLTQNLQILSGDMTNTSINDLNPISPEYQSLSMQMVNDTQQLRRSFSNISQQSLQLKKANKQITQQLRLQNQNYVQMPSQTQIPGEIFKRQQENFDHDGSVILRSNSGLNISQNYGTNQLNKSSGGNVNDTSILVNAQDQSCFNDSFIRYLAADQKLNNTNMSALHETHHEIQNYKRGNTMINPNQSIHGILEVCASPMTARFSSFQNHLQKHKNVLLASDLSRQNIQENTKNLLGEISDIDQEIVALQGTLFSAMGTSQDQLERNDNQSQILISEGNLLDETSANNGQNNIYGNNYNLQNSRYQTSGENITNPNIHLSSNSTNNPHNTHHFSNQINFNNLTSSQGCLASNTEEEVQRTIDFENNQNVNDFSLIDEYDRNQNDDCQQ
ncbi:UNKNOWN [Stylonychia lemnae]|uniref:Uncharacterized protein n=1 Tax=Stylonychia lemnae TaxID=5949 RepID=A0A078ACD2_STYLE|nr:UNKNOWN [Stylonychia lemnae]|eukprot:CDW79501.1 UNKNOWN [Stylonychia lemnae]